MKHPDKFYLQTLSILLSGLFCCLTNSLISQTLPNTNPIISLQQKNIVADYLRQFPDKTQIALVLIDDGRIRYCGVLKSDNQIEEIENKESVFEVGSITKVFTSTLLLELVSDSILTLDESISGILPYNLNQSSIDGKPITFKTLANHTSGLPFEPDNINLSVQKNPDNPYLNYTQALMDEYLSKMVLLHATPGEKFLYSNLGFGLLGYLMEVKTGLDYESLVVDYVFKKYNMNYSTTEFQKVDDLMVSGLDTVGNEIMHWHTNALKASGGVLSNVADLSKFLVANFSDNPILTKQREITFSRMNNHIALGWEVFDIGGTDCSMKWHYKTGGMGGFSSAVIMDADAKLGIAVLTNISAFHRHENTLQLSVDLLKEMYAPETKKKRTDCVAPFLSMALKEGWGTHLNNRIKVDGGGNPIAGVWKKNSDSRERVITRTFFSNGKVQSDFTGDPEIDVWGYYNISGNLIVFDDVGGNACKSKGQYKYQIENDKLRFVIIEDNCDGRMYGLTGTWYREK